MRSILRNLLLSSTALCTTAAFGANPMRLDVPFNFVAKGHEYHAGRYIVEINSGRSFVTLSHIGEPVLPLMWVVMPGDTDPYHPKVSMTFDVMGQDHVLRTIQYGALITPNLDSHPKHRVESTRTIGQ